MHFPSPLQVVSPSHASTSVAGGMKTETSTSLSSQALLQTLKTAALFFLFTIVAIHLDASRLQAATVDIHPGADIPTIVSNNPAGTTFLIYPGLYRLQKPIRALDGDRFIGQTACAPPKTSCPAILSGSEQLTSFQYDGTYYSVADQTQQGEVNITTMQCEPELPAYPTAYPGCMYPEDLFFDGVPLVHVTALSNVVSGTWYFDYTNHIIYFHDNPAGHMVETSVVPSAFSLGPANNLTIEYLTVEEFAAPILKGAIQGTPGGATTTGANWVVENNEIRLNHGAGVGINYGWQILNNYIHTNGNLGIAGGTSNTIPSNALVQGNNVAFNNYAHVKPGFGAGGIKIANSLGVVFRGNNSHDNEGSGFHSDLATYNDLYDNNISSHNTEEGILHEISYNGTFRNNQLLNNGYVYPNGTDWFYGANLLSSTSQNDQAYCNTVEISAQGGNGIDIIGQPRDSSGGSTISQNNSFTYNTVIFEGSSGWTGGGRDSRTDICCTDFFSANNFDYNTYHLPSLNRASFFWSARSNNVFGTFQASGQDVHGSADTNYTSAVPTVVITSPKDMAVVSGVVTVQGTAQKNINTVDFYVDWELKQTATASPFSFSWNTSGVTAGQHTITAMAYNTAGMRACYAIWLQVN